MIIYGWGSIPKRPNCARKSFDSFRYFLTESQVLNQRPDVIVIVLNT